MHGPINVKSPNNTSKWQMGFNSAFKGLNRCQTTKYFALLWTIKSINYYGVSVLLPSLTRMKIASFLSRIISSSVACLPLLVCPHYLINDTIYERQSSTGKGFIVVLQYFSVNCYFTTAPHSTSYIFHQRYIILGTDRVVTQNTLVLPVFTLSLSVQNKLPFKHNVVYHKQIKWWKMSKWFTNVCFATQQFLTSLPTWFVTVWTQTHTYNCVMNCVASFFWFSESPVNITKFAVVFPSPSWIVLLIVRNHFFQTLPYSSLTL